MPNSVVIAARARLELALVILVGALAVESPGAEWNGVPAGRWLALTPVASSNDVGFTLLPASQTGVSFANLLSSDRSITNHVLLNGSGVAAGDVDGDGWTDLYFCGLDSANKLYRNLGNWRFEDVTTFSGVACAGLDATGAALADLDGDGDLDLVVNTIADGTRLFFNDGHGRFAPAPNTPILNERQAGTSLALADMDGDGALDLYITNYRPMFFFQDKPETRYTMRMAGGQPTVALIDGKPLTDPEYTNRFVFQVHMAEGKITLGKEELGQVDALYRNDGRGHFTLVPFTGGAFIDEDGQVLAEPPRDWGLSVAFRDLNQDGHPDLYICNDFRTPDRIWINDGRGRFRAVSRLSIRQTCLSAMALDVADVNRDGWFDIFVADMLSTDHARRLMQRIDLRPELLGPGQIDNRPQFSRNMLQLSRGDGTFAEVAQLCGLDASDWTWSTIFLDVDLDGYEDLLVANGFERDTMNVDAQRQFEMTSHQQKLTGLERLKLRKLYPRLATPNLGFRNLGDGRFANVSAIWRFNAAEVSQGMCAADLDNDGDLDLVLNNMNAPAGLYRNDATAPRLAVRLKGAPPNTRGIGARIEVFGGPAYQTQEMVCGGRYCSSDDPIRAFAAGALTNPLTLVVTWRSGKRSIIENAQPNRLYEVDEAVAVPLTTQARALPAGPTSAAWLAASTTTDSVSPLFTDTSDLLRHSHTQQPFDDFARQPLLPWKLSQLGPAMSWSDVDEDGRDDLIVGAGAGQPPAILRNTSRGFEPRATKLGSASGDHAGLLVYRTGAGAVHLLLAESTCAERNAQMPCLVLADLTNGAPRALLTNQASSIGPLALGDIDADGDLDLFVGGRVIPGHFPQPASSLLFRNENGQFFLDPANSRSLTNLGLISGAVFADLDSDGHPELVLACQWGPVRILRNERGVLQDATPGWGMTKLTGWWNAVTAGDFDEDGRLDLVASNWGRNTRYESFRARPLRLYYGDFNGDGSVQSIEAYQPANLVSYVSWRRLDDMAKAMPFLNARYSSFEPFGRAPIDDILGDRLGKATILEAHCLESTLFLNRGDHFEARPLPLEAQIAPSFGIAIADFDGDGHEDLFLAQNFFDVPPEVSRCDAGRGLLLRGDGKGGFTPLSANESGLRIYGEQRAAVLADYDADGRVDLAVAQNGAQTRLFHNTGGVPGLRVRLEGPPGNPDGIGTVLRLKVGERWGPAREIHAGAGYWSQDSPVTVLAFAGGASELEAVWPGGRRVLYQISGRAKEIKIDASGRATVIR